jgi:predicted Zn-dependent peptidase
MSVSSPARIAHAASSHGKPAQMPQVKVVDYRLKNGLRVLLAPDKVAPVIAISVAYDVGSRNERPGRTGFAHLFEHLMFQGSENVGRGEHFVLINDNGGSFNGTTNQDRTNYFATLPANQLDLALFLEADRMRALDISQQNLDNQRAVVQEERRQSYDNQPYGQVQEAVLDLVYNSFAYKHSTIGSMADLNAARLEDVRAFYKTYYAPNNAALALAGDFDVAEARTKIEKYFGAIPRQPAPPSVDLHAPPPSGERRKTLTDPLARLPRYTTAYLTMPGDHKDAYALSILGDILGGGRGGGGGGRRRGQGGARGGGGRTSRLYQAIVEQDLALSVSVSARPGRGPSLFMIAADLPSDGDVATLETAVDREIARVQAEGVTAAELEKTRTQARMAAVGSLQTALGRANTLAEYAVFYNDPNRINTLLSRLQAVTAADVQRVARQYLTRGNRVVVLVQPAVGTPNPPLRRPAPAAGSTGTSQGEKD